jgi:hypothetical protein
MSCEDGVRKKTKEEGKTSLNVGEERRGVKEKARKEIYGSMSVTSASKSKFLAMVEPATPPPTTTIRFFMAIIVSSRILPVALANGSDKTE